jgi:hypothetical protein
MAVVLAAVLCACAGPRQPELGSAEPEADSCMDNDAGRRYLKAVWRELQDEWVLPRGIPADQQAEVIIVFDERGDPKELFVARDTNQALAESIEKAIARADLPPTPEELRPCVARQRMSARFRNPERTR